MLLVKLNSEQPTNLPIIAQVYLNASVDMKIEIIYTAILLRFYAFLHVS